MQIPNALMPAALEENRRRAALWFALGLAAGALAMYLSDPVSGRRRRSTAQEKAKQWRDAPTPRPIGRKAKDLANRARGLTHRVSKAARGKQAPVDDTTLEARVRTALGKIARVPQDIVAQVQEGHVELSGRVGRMEQRAVVHGVRRVDGARAVTNHMQAYDEHAAPSETATR